MSNESFYPHGLTKRWNRKADTFLEKKGKADTIRRSLCRLWLAIATVRPPTSSCASWFPVTRDGLARSSIPKHRLITRACPSSPLLFVCSFPACERGAQRGCRRTCSPRTNTSMACARGGIICPLASGAGGRGRFVAAPAPRGSHAQQARALLRRGVLGVGRPSGQDAGRRPCRC